MMRGHRRAPYPRKVVVPGGRRAGAPRAGPGVSISGYGRASAVLVPGRGLEPDHQFSRHATAVLDLDALRLGPLTNLGGVDSAGRGPAPAPGRPPGRAGAPPPRVNVPGQCLPQRCGVLCVQVDLVLGTIQRKADGALGLSAIDVIDEQGLYLLGHVCSVSLVELSTRLDDSPAISTHWVPC